MQRFQGHHIIQVAPETTSNRASSNEEEQEVVSRTIQKIDGPDSIQADEESSE